MHSNQMYQQVIEANIALHSRMAADYSTCEPHFRPENVAKVTHKLRELAGVAGAGRMLDLGCGTGFMINIGRSIFREIHGVDVTQAMLDRVDRSGSAHIELTRADTGSFEVQPGTFDVVTAYSFLHHLYDCGPTLKTAWRALKPGGCFYSALDPNQDFWAAIGRLDRHGAYHSILHREIEMVTFKDEDIQKQFGVDTEVFNQAEYGKSILGGFSDSYLRDKLMEAGFSRVEIFYEWFVGQGQLINDAALPREIQLNNANVVHELLERALPLSRPLFKYIGFVAMR